jgi:ribose transport system ATP-binding protein
MLLKVIESLKAQGIAILYVSHRLPEVQQISDRIVALRDGKNSGEALPPAITRESLIQMIVGRELKDIYGYQPRARGVEVLSVQDFKASALHKPCSFSIHAGEIVGIAGLVGSGRSELLNSLFGITVPRSGSIHLNRSEVSIKTPTEAWALGIALVPESRKEQGLLLEGTIRENIVLSDQKKRSLAAPRNARAEIATTNSFISSLRIKCGGSEQPTKNLSGGNQQKVVIAKCLHTNPKVLLLDEPTRGVDVGARREIYNLLFELAKEGMAILFVSSELEEIIGIADRVLVMSDGEIRGELPRANLSEHEIMHIASSLSQVAA